MFFLQSISSIFADNILLLAITFGWAALDFANFPRGAIFFHHCAVLLIVQVLFVLL